MAIVAEALMPPLVLWEPREGAVQATYAVAESGLARAIASDEH